MFPGAFDSEATPSDEFDTPSPNFTSSAVFDSIPPAQFEYNSDSEPLSEIQARQGTRKRRANNQSTPIAKKRALLTSETEEVDEHNERNSAGNGSAMNVSSAAELNGPIPFLNMNAGFNEPLGSDIEMVTTPQRNKRSFITRKSHPKVQIKNSPRTVDVLMAKNQKLKEERRKMRERLQAMETEMIQLKTQMIYMQNVPVCVQCCMPSEEDFFCGVACKIIHENNNGDGDHA